MRETVAENCRDVFMDHEDVVDHRVHFGVPEQDREVVTQDFLKLVGLLVVAN